MLTRELTNVFAYQPDVDTLFSFGGAQPFVPLYAVVLGKGGHIFMNVVSIVTLWLVGPFLSGQQSSKLTAVEYCHRYSCRFSPGICSST